MSDKTVVRESDKATALIFLTALAATIETHGMPSAEEGAELLADCMKEERAVFDEVVDALRYCHNHARPIGVIQDVTGPVLAKVVAHRE